MQAELRSLFEEARNLENRQQLEKWGHCFKIFTACSCVLELVRGAFNAHKQGAPTWLTYNEVRDSRKNLLIVEVLKQCNARCGRGAACDPKLEAARIRLLQALVCTSTERIVGPDQPHLADKVKSFDTALTFEYVAAKHGPLRVEHHDEVQLPALGLTLGSLCLIVADGGRPAEDGDVLLQLEYVWDGICR